MKKDVQIFVCNEQMVGAIEDFGKAVDANLVRDLVHFLLTAHSVLRVVELPAVALVFIELDILCICLLYYLISVFLLFGFK